MTILRPARKTALLPLAVLLVGCAGAPGSAGPTPTEPRQSQSSTVPTPSMVPTLAPTQPTVQPGEPWIVYQGGSGAGGATPLRLVRPDGSDDHQLATAPLPGYDQGHPAWSSDGAMIAFDLFTKVAGSPDRVAIWLVDVDGSSARELATCSLPCLQLAYPVWSPDGAEIAIARYNIAAEGRWGLSAIEVVDVASGQRRVVAQTSDGTTAYYTPRWSPDGRAIVFVVETYPDAAQERVLTSSIAVVELTASDPARPMILTPIEVVALNPDWAPADRIVFVTAPSIADIGRTSNIATMNVDGSDVRVLTSFTSASGPAFEPTWIRGGKRIMFVHGEASGEVIVLMEADGSGLDAMPWRLVTPTGIQRTHAHLRPTP